MKRKIFFASFVVDVGLEFNDQFVHSLLLEFSKRKKRELERERKKGLEDLVKTTPHTLSPVAIITFGMLLNKKGF